MDLFVVNRYVGDDAERPVITQEKHHLNDLLSKIEKRKKLKELKTVNNRTSDISHFNGGDVIEQNDGNTDQLKYDIELLSHVKKKKKKKIVCNNTEIVDNSYNGDVTLYDDTHDCETLDKIIKDDSITTPNKEKRNKRKNNDSEKILTTNSNNDYAVPSSKKKRKKKALNDSNECSVKEEKDEEELHNDSVQTKEHEEGTLDSATAGFTVIGSDNFHKKTKVKRVLPQWLANPSVVSVNLKLLNVTIDSIKELDDDIVQKLRENNITHFFPVQSQFIPWLLKTINKPPMFWPNDVCVSAPTGSGKTLAFVLPIVQALKKRVVPKIRALVVLPVQDLAEQVYKVFRVYCKGTNLKVALVTGQNIFSEEQEQLVRENIAFGMQTLVDIVVTTPGRLVDHINLTTGFSLQHLRFLVIDEADRVIESLQNDWLYHVNKCVQGEASQYNSAPPLTVHNLQTSKPPPQKLLFSATLSQDPEKLQLLGLFQPKLFTSVVEGQDTVPETSTGEIRGDFIGKYTTPAELVEKYCVVSAESKPLVLYHLITSRNWKRVLCFVNSQQAAHRLSLLLQILCDDKLKCSEISARLRRQDRNEIISQFSAGNIDILVSSDALARGMDIPKVKYVVSYELPKYVKNYVHRIGRTGRAGKKGTAVTLLLSKQVQVFQKMLKTAGKNAVEEDCVLEDDLFPLEEIYKDALSKLKERLEEEQNQLLLKIKKEKKPMVGNPIKTTQPRLKINKSKINISKKTFERKKSFKNIKEINEN